MVKDPSCVHPKLCKYWASSCGCCYPGAVSTPDVCNICDEFVERKDSDPDPVCCFGCRSLSVP